MSKVVNKILINGQPFWYFRAVFGQKFEERYKSGIPLDDIIYNNGGKSIFNKGIF